MGGQLDFSVNGISLSRQHVLQVIEERVSRTTIVGLLDSQVELSVTQEGPINTNTVHRYQYQYRSHHPPLQERNPYENYLIQS